MPADRPAHPNRRRALLGGVAFAGGLAGLATGMKQVHADDDEPIIGSWLIQFTGVGQRTQLLRIAIFLPGGVALETDAPISPTSDLNDNPASLEYQTILAGQWLRTDFSTYRYRVLGVDYDAIGNPIGVDTITSTVEFDRLRDTWTATRSFRDNALDGTLRVQVIPATPVQATRIGVEP